MTKLGPYEILSHLGAGGMGEVYKAHDPRLGRTVAIKKLKDRFSDRFEREARAIAALNHPHICTLYDVGPDYLVMEYVDGQPLKGPVPLGKALDYGIQITGALAAAHRRGIVHRDLKPANILLTKSGVKVLDFGLAKHLHGPAQAETFTAPLTEEGVIAGTLGYMAPEQLEGKDADARADIFSAGCVLYEMITGRRAFEGGSRASLIAAVMKVDPQPPSSLQPAIPEALDRAIQKCLRKDPDRRWQSAADLEDELRWILMKPPASPAQPNGVTRRQVLTSAGAAFGVGVATVLGVTAARHGGRDSQPVQRFTIPSPGRSIPAPAAYVSPDGRHIVISAVDTEGKRRLWVRTLDAITSRELPGTENAGGPFWSPDSRFIFFFQNGAIRKVDAGNPSRAGSIRTVATGIAGGEFGTCSAEGAILLSLAAGGGLFLLPAGDATLIPVTQPDKSRRELLHHSPIFLADGRNFLFISGRTGNADIMASSLDSQQPRVLVEGVGLPSVIALAPAHERGNDTFLLYVSGRRLLARRLDPATVRLRGSPVEVAGSVDASAISASANGALVYGTLNSDPGRRLCWSNRKGVFSDLPVPIGRYASAEVSPDGGSIAIETLGDEASGEIGVFDIARETLGRLTLQSGWSYMPVWSPDGARIAFAASRRTPGSPYRIYTQIADGRAGEELVWQVKTTAHPHLWDWTPDGSHLLFGEAGDDLVYKLFLLPLSASQAKPAPLFPSPFSKTHAKFSPDGRWLAYTSRESGKGEVYVQEFSEPGFLPGRKLQISANGGSHARWSAQGKELFFRSGGGQLMSVDLQLGATLKAGVPRALFDLSGAPLSFNRYPYDTTDDSDRFLVNIATGDTAPVMTIVLNWSAAAG